MATKRVQSEKKTSAPKRVRAAKSVDSVELESLFSVDRDAIARRAFERFQARGHTHGQDREDWLAAERELSKR